MHKGCDPACGYQWGYVGMGTYHKEKVELEDGSKSSQVRQSLRLGCASSFPIVVPYCQHVSRPPFWGCSLACGFYYSLEEERCVKRELKTEL